MVVEIDQSGKLEQLDTGTAVAYANGKSSALWINAGTKREIIKRLRKTLIPNHDLWAIVFSIVIYLLIIDSGKNRDFTLVIDEEYTGKQEIIEETIRKLIKKKSKNKWDINFRFVQIGKRSPAHKLSWEIHRNKNRNKVRVVEIEEIMELVD